jgi:hypothetical protein
VKEGGAMTGNATTGIRLGSVVLGSTDPQRLRSWYRAVLATEHDSGGLGLELDAGSRLIFDRRTDVATVTSEPGRILVNLYVDDLETVAVRLAGLGVGWIRPIEAFPPGLISTVEDPDGNYVQFIQFAERTAT